MFSRKETFNPFLASVPILYPLKTPENLWFSGVFRGYEMGTLARNGLMLHCEMHSKECQVGEVFFQNDWLDTACKK